MFDRRLDEVMNPPSLLVSPEITVTEAARRMTAQSLGAVMVVEGDVLVGIFTERDALTRVLAAGRDPLSTRVAEVMTREPRTMSPDKRFGVALALMHRHGFRHVPVVADGRPVGMVTARMALDPDMEDFVVEARRRDQFMTDEAE